MHLSSSGREFKSITTEHRRVNYAIGLAFIVDSTSRPTRSAAGPAGVHHGAWSAGQLRQQPWQGQRPRVRL